MKQTWVRLSAFVLAVAFLAPATLLAQKDDKDKVKEEKTKEKKDVQQIIITTKGDSKEKTVVEINDGKVTINGKPLDEYKDKDGNLSVHINKFKGDYDMKFNNFKVPGGAFSYNSNNAYNVFSSDSNRAMLGVTTEKTDEGVKVNDVTKESAAERIGLKEGDIITKLDDTKIETSDDLSEAVQKHKPGEKVSITYLRDKKEQKATVELTKWKGVSLFRTGEPFNLNLDAMNFDRSTPRALAVPRVKTLNGQAWSWAGNGPKLGLSVQDTDDGKGVKVIDVDDESNAAKAGVKEDDVISEVDGKAVNSTDDMVKIIKDSKEKATINLKLQRGGKTQNIEVKMPHKIKTADL